MSPYEVPLCLHVSPCVSMSDLYEVSPCLHVDMDMECLHVCIHIEIFC